MSRLRRTEEPRVGYIGLLCCYLVLSVVQVEAQDPAQQAMLDLHNKVRGDFGLPLFRWDPSLGVISQAWADDCMGDKLFQHSTNRSMGENISWLYNSKYKSALDAVPALFQGWYAELVNFVNAPVPYDASIGHVVGHISQILWRDSTSLGCGISGDYPQYFAVCNFLPPGNVWGQKAF